MHNTSVGVMIYEGSFIFSVISWLMLRSSSLFVLAVFLRLFDLSAKLSAEDLRSATVDTSFAFFFLVFSISSSTMRLFDCLAPSSEIQDKLDKISKISLATDAEVLNSLVMPTL